MSAVIVCGGSYISRWWVGRCWGACDFPDSVIVSTEGSPWYGSTQRCTNCGDMWAEGEMYPRPFQRGWRQKSIARAVATFEAACDCKVERDKDLYPIPCGCGVSA